MRKPLMVMLAAAMAVIGLAAPAQATATAVDMPFGMAFGNSTTTGTIHFTDGYTATVSGAVHAVSSDLVVCTYGVNGGAQSDFICSNLAIAGAQNQPLNAPLRIPVTGGVQRVYITMYDRLAFPFAQEFCTRKGCTREF